MRLDSHASWGQHLQCIVCAANLAGPQCLSRRSQLLTWSCNDIRRGKGAQLAACLRFRVDIDEVPRYFRLLLLPPGAEIAAKARRTLPQVNYHATWFRCYIATALDNAAQACCHSPAKFSCLLHQSNPERKELSQARRKPCRPSRST